MPPSDPINNVFEEATRFWNAIQTLCAVHHGSVIGGIRTRKHNVRLKGSPTSLHLLGLAANVVFDTIGDRMRAVQDAPRLGLYYRPQEGHVHFQSRPIEPELKPPAYLTSHYPIG
jgi:hypothetical protein